MSNALLATEHVHAMTGNCRPQAVADLTSVKRSNCAIISTESGQDASYSTCTHQQLLSSDHNNQGAALAAQVAGKPAGNMQPASPDSVNAGQPAAAAATAVPVRGVNALTAGQQQMPAHSSPAPAQDSAGGTVVEQEQQQMPLQEHLEPLTPPDASDDHEVHDEYDMYLERWKEGSTMRQRWHRLKAKGLLAGIQADWEDWQHDMLLDTIQMQLSNPGSTSTAAATAAAAVTAGRSRRGRADMETSAGAVSGGQETRRVRTRRAPASFQDFHVETPVPTGSPDRTDTTSQAGFSATDMQRRTLHTQQQQQYYNTPPSWDGAARNGANSRQQPHLQQPAQSQPRPSNLGRQQAQGSKPPGAQQQGGDTLSEEFIRRFRATIELVRSSGHAAGMEGAAALLADPEALKAYVSALSQHMDNPAAAMHRLAATLAGQATQY